jgi:hypothetical protein
MVTAEVWERIVRLACGSKSGTGFILDRNDRQYLVTAAHVIKSGAPVNVLVRGNSVSVTLVALPVPIADADVAVFRLDRHIAPPNLPLAADMTGMVYGQDAYFLGFPLGMTFDLEDGYLPLVKRCTISGTNRKVKGRHVLLLDGWNNPGFSGAPVVFRPATGAPGSPMRVAGVVTAYATQPGELAVGGQIVPNTEVLMNSGIIIAEQITRVTEAIDADIPLELSR